MKKIVLSLLLIAFVFAGFTNTALAQNVKAGADGKISDNAIVDENEPGLLIDTGGPSFIRGDKFEGETDPNFLPPKDYIDKANKKMFAAGVAMIALLVIAYLLLRLIKDSSLAKILSILILAIIIATCVTFIYTKMVSAQFVPLSSTSCTLKGQTYSSWEALTSAVAGSGYCTGGSGYSTGGSSNRPSSYSWSCTGWNGYGYVVTDSCSVTVTGSSGGGTSGGGSC